MGRRSETQQVSDARPCFYDKLTNFLTRLNSKVTLTIMNKVLYIDDASSMRKLVRMVIGNEFDLTLADDGQQGLEALSRHQFDVIISDINMPVMTGLEFLEAARKLDNYKFTPILMMTTEASQEMKDQGRNLGATGWIVKPFDPEKLPTIIRKVLN